MEKTFTVATRIDAPVGSEIRMYLDDFVSEYSRCFRYMWHEMTSPDFASRHESMSRFVSHTMRKFNFLKRTVNSIKYEITGRMKSYMGLKKVELADVEIRIHKENDNIKNIIEKLNVHQAASYVIARRGQGYIDRYQN